MGDFFGQALVERAIEPRAAFAAPREQRTIEPLLHDVRDWFERLLQQGVVRQRW